MLRGISGGRSIWASPVRLWAAGCFEKKGFENAVNTTQHSVLRLATIPHYLPSSPLFLSFSSCLSRAFLVGIEFKYATTRYKVACKWTICLRGYERYFSFHQIRFQQIADSVFGWFNRVCELSLAFSDDTPLLDTNLTWISPLRGEISVL